MWRLFGLVFRARSERAQLPVMQEIAAGDWHIQSSGFFTASLSQISVSHYSVKVAPTADEATFEGQIIAQNDTAAPDSDFVRLVFDPANDTCFSLLIGDDSNFVSIADFSISTANIGFKFATGSLLLPNVTYSLSILSYKAVEFTVVNALEKRVTIFRLFKTVDANAARGGGSIVQFLPLVLVLLFLCQKRGRTQDAAAEQDAEGDANQDEGEEQDEAEKVKED
jgi:hypothetical protein